MIDAGVVGGKRVRRDVGQVDSVQTKGRLNTIIQLMAGNGGAVLEPIKGEHEPGIDVLCTNEVQRLKKQKSERCRDSEVEASPIKVPDAG
jgi:hypothetical protein